MSPDEVLLFFMSWLLGQVSTARTCGRESRERESSYGDSKRWMRREKGEGEIENKDNHATHLFHELEPCVYVTRMRSVNVIVHALYPRGLH